MRLMQQKDLVACGSANEPYVAGVEVGITPNIFSQR